MLKKLLASLLFFFLINCAWGQTKVIPSNLKQAIIALQKDCSDSLKSLIKETPDDKLIKLSYPWGGDFRTISNWFDDRNDFKKIGQYFTDRGINYIPHKEEIILVAFKKKLLGFACNEKELLQPYQKTEKKWAIEDKARYTTDSLRGVYIPENLHECFKQIDSFWSDSTKARVKNWTESEFSGNAHRGFGMWMRNNWQLWAGSRLTRYFNQMGVYHAESMSGIILDSYHRYLSGKSIRLQEQLDEDKRYWAEAKQKELKRKTDEFDEYSIGDTIEYKYPHDYVSKQQEELEDNDSCSAKGIVIEKNKKLFQLKIQLIETCDNKGIIIYSDKNRYVYENKKLVRIRKPTVILAKKNAILWFDYDAWETK